MTRNWWDECEFYYSQHSFALPCLKLSPKICHHRLTLVLSSFFLFLPPHFCTWWVSVDDVLEHRTTTKYFHSFFIIQTHFHCAKYTENDLGTICSGGGFCQLLIVLFSYALMAYISTSKHTHRHAHEHFSFNFRLFKEQLDLSRGVDTKLKNVFRLTPLHIYEIDWKRVSASEWMNEWVKQNWWGNTEKYIYSFRIVKVSLIVSVSFVCFDSFGIVWNGNGNGITQHPASEWTFRFSPSGIFLGSRSVLALSFPSMDVILKGN